jgi:hypothetical protein
VAEPEDSAPLTAKPTSAHHPEVFQQYPSSIHVPDSTTLITLISHLVTYAQLNLALRTILRCTGYLRKNINVGHIITDYSEHKIASIHLPYSKRLTRKYSTEQ